MHGRRIAVLAALGAVQTTLGPAARPAARSLHGQAPELRGYYLHIVSAADSGLFSPSAATDFKRLRAMLSPTVGPLEVEIAYEHVLSASTAADPGFATGLGTAAGGEWAHLQGTLAESGSVEWRHRVDRLAVSYAPLTDVELTLGRQTISWATTLLLTPADPFAPFTPEEPFRDYRAGVDAFRARAFLGPFSDLDLVARPTDTSEGTTLTALARLHTVISGWELSTWAGLLHDGGAAAVGVTGTFAGAAARAEGVVRRVDDSTALRFTVGVDRSFPVAGRDLYLVAEYQRDGLGAASVSDLPIVLASGPFERGELQVVGRHTAALQASYQPDALWATSLLLLSNLGDPSLLIGPGVSYSVSDEATARAGIFLGFGDELAADGVLPGSEYGAVPSFAYVALAAFF
jgi:hypothetical protein